MSPVDKWKRVQILKSIGPKIEPWGTPQFLILVYSSVHQKLIYPGFVLMLVHGLSAALG